MNAVILILVLFGALLVLLPLVERFGPRYSPEKMAKISRWIWPLLMILLFTQLLKAMLG